MIDFVLQDACVPTRSFDRLGLSMLVEAIDANVAIARDNCH
jgi:hypothetical protein